MFGFLGKSIKLKLGSIVTVMFILNILTIVSILILLQQQKDYANSIDEAGKMSMLSQTIPKDAFLLANDYKEVKQTLKENSDKYDQVISNLINGSQERSIMPSSPEIKAEIEKTSVLWNTIKKDVNVLLTTGKYNDGFVIAVESIKDKNLALLNQADLAVKTITNESKTKIQNTLNFLYLFLFLSVVTFVLALVTVINIVKPIIELTKATKTITRFNLRSNVNVTTNDEIGELAKNFNHMLSNLEDNISKDLKEINY